MSSLFDVDLDVNVASRCVGVRANLMRRVDYFLRLRAFYAREMDSQLARQTEPTRIRLTEGYFRMNLHIFDRDMLLPTDYPDGLTETRSPA